MRRYNIVSRVLLILAVITFALAAPVQVQKRRQAPEDSITALEKRVLEGNLDGLWDGLWHYKNVLGDATLPPNSIRPAEPDVRVPPAPPNPAGAHVPEVHAPQPNPAEEPAPELFAPPPNLPYVLVPEGHAPPPNRPFLSVVNILAPPRNPATVYVGGVPLRPYRPAESDRELMDVGDDAPPGSPRSGYSVSPPPSPRWSTRSEDWTHWYEAPSSLGRSTGSDSDSDDWQTTISSPPSVASQSENLKAADSDYELKGNAKVPRHISGTASGVDIVNAAEIELRSAVDLRPYVSAFPSLSTNHSAD